MNPSDEMSKFMDEYIAYCEEYWNAMPRRLKKKKNVKTMFDYCILEMPPNERCDSVSNFLCWNMYLWLLKNGYTEPMTKEEVIPSKEFIVWSFCDKIIRTLETPLYRYFKDKDCLEALQIAFITELYLVL